MLYYITLDIYKMLRNKTYLSIKQTCYMYTINAL